MTPTPQIPLLDCKVLCRSRGHTTGRTVVQHRKSFNCFPQSRKTGCLLDWRLEVTGTQKSFENFTQLSLHLTGKLFFKISGLPNHLQFPCWMNISILNSERTLNKGRSLFFLREISIFFFHLYFKLREKVTRIKDHWKWTSLLWQRNKTWTIVLINCSNHFRDTT